MPKRATLSTRSLSTSTATTDQIPKNSGLTGAELDSNFLELRDQTFGVVGDDSSTIDIAAGGTLYIQGGTNCSTTTNSDGSITINTQADQDVFKTISVAGQNDVVADSTTDSLTLVAGNGMTITTDNSTDSITFTSNADIGDLQVTAYGGGSDETFLNPGSEASTNANLILSGRNTGKVLIADDLIVGYGGSTTSNILSVTNDTITHTSAGGTVTDRLILQGGTNQDDQHSAVNLLARTIELNNNTNVTLTARGGDGDFYISNGGVAASNNLGTATIGHNSIVLTDDNDGEITINPKGGKWVDINSQIRIKDTNIKALGSADTLELEANSQHIHNKVNKTTFGSGDGSSNSTLTTTTNADMILSTNNGTASGSITIQDGANNQIRLIPDGTGDVVIGNFTFDADQIVGAGTDDYVFTYDNSTGKISLEPAGGGASLGDLTAVGSTLISPSNADLTLAPSGTGKVNISAAYTLPSSDGNAGEVLQTNGSGVLAFATASAINIDGGTAASTYGAITAIDGGDAT